MSNGKRGFFARLLDAAADFFVREDSDEEYLEMEEPEKVPPSPPPGPTGGIPDDEWEPSGLFDDPVGPAPGVMEPDAFSTEEAWVSMGLDIDVAQYEGTYNVTLNLKGFSLDGVIADAPDPIEEAGVMEDLNARGFRVTPDGWVWEAEVDVAHIDRNHYAKAGWDEWRDALEWLEEYYNDIDWFYPGDHDGYSGDATVGGF